MIDTLAQRTTASNSKKKKPRVFGYESKAITGHPDWYILKSHAAADRESDEKRKRAAAEADAAAAAAASDEDGIVDRFEYGSEADSESESAPPADGKLDSSFAASKKPADRSDRSDEYELHAPDVRGCIAAERSFNTYDTVSIKLQSRLQNEWFMLHQQLIAHAMPFLPTSAGRACVHFPSNLKCSLLRIADNFRSAINFENSSTTQSVLRHMQPDTTDLSSAPDLYSNRPSSAIVDREPVMAPYKHEPPCIRLYGVCSNSKKAGSTANSRHMSLLPTATRLARYQSSIALVLASPVQVDATTTARDVFEFDSKEANGLAICWPPLSEYVLLPRALPIEVCETLLRMKRALHTALHACTIGWSLPLNSGRRALFADLLRQAMTLAD